MRRGFGAGDEPPSDGFHKSRAFSLRTSAAPVRTIAKDPEGNAVIFELETAQTGMVIGRTTGRVTRKVPSSLKGTHRVKIVVADSKGVRSWQDLIYRYQRRPARLNFPPGTIGCSKGGGPALAAHTFRVNHCH